MKTNTAVTEQPPQRIALIDLIGRGDPFKLPIVGETTFGFVCRTGPKDSPAEEFFAYKSVHGSATEITKQ